MSIVCINTDSANGIFVIKNSSTLGVVTLAGYNVDGVLGQTVAAGQTYVIQSTGTDYIRIN